MLRTGTPLLPLCLLLLAGLLLGCGNRRPLTPMLNRAEALMEDHPDSAYALLRTIDSTSLAPGEEQAHYALLYTQARDKNYIVQTDDSLIQVAVRYYDSIGRADRQALAYYLWGGVYRDLNRQADALERYLRAADLVQQYNDDYLSSRIFNNPQIRNFVCCGLMGWDLIRLVMPMSGIELQIAADVHSYPLPHDAA